MISKNAYLSKKYPKKHHFQTEKATDSA